MVDTTTIFVIGLVVGFAISVALPQIPKAINEALSKAKKESEHPRINAN